MTVPTIDDPDWDWLPITAGADITVGDTIIYAFTSQIVVSTIVTAANAEGGTKYTYSDGTTSLIADWPPLTQGLRYDRAQYVVTLYPLVGAKFRHPDGSRWVFAGSKAYRCYVGSTSYPVGTVMPRSVIGRGLVAE